jgi:hypothetical protein
MRRARAKYYIALRKRRAAMRRTGKKLPPIKMPESMKNFRQHRRKLIKGLRSRFKKQR